MSYLLTLEEMQWTLRGEVCTRCFRRPPESESQGAVDQRSCQGDCAVFQNLRRLKQIVEKIDSASTDPYEQAMRDTICKGCPQNSDPEGYCDQYSARACPLCRYSGRVIEVLKELADTPITVPADTSPMSQQSHRTALADFTSEG